MSVARQERIQKLIDHAKKILPEIEAKITKEMQEEINEDYKYMDEKPEIDKTELNERVKDAVLEEIKKCALLKFGANRKTVSEYCQIVLMRLELE